VYACVFLVFKHSYFQTSTNFPSFNRLHRLGSAPTFGSDNNSFGLTHHNSTSNLQGCNDIFKAQDRSCNLDFTNSSFADGLSGLIMNDKERQENGIATGK